MRSGCFASSRISRRAAGPAATASAIRPLRASSRSAFAAPRIRAATAITAAKILKFSIQYAISVQKYARGVSFLPDTGTDGVFVFILLGGLAVKKLWVRHKERRTPLSVSLNHQAGGSVPKVWSGGVRLYFACGPDVESVRSRAKKMPEYFEPRIGERP